MRRWPQDRSECENQRKIINPTCINCNAQATWPPPPNVPLFPKPRKGTTGPLNQRLGRYCDPSLKDRSPIFMFPPLTGVETILVALTSDQEPFWLPHLCPTKSKLQKLGADLDARLNVSSRKRKYPDSGAARVPDLVSPPHINFSDSLNLLSSRNKDECTAAVFLDIQKAFDRVWHTGLLFKLITYKIRPSYFC
ncbi:hypothetical protein TNCV_3759041 [Trichonephila clavipes]|nr:hypothetical protein TNCV_3759041 [Trichonephila clavipes]